MIRLMLLLLIFHSAQTGYAQKFEVDTSEALDVIKKWNFANNAMSESTFREIYADKLLFYTQTLTKEKCIALKRSLITRNPSFKQKIISDPVFHIYTAGVLKADFIKEVFQNGKWRKYPSYLLITYTRNKYVITGESDLDTDRKLKYKLEIGVKMDIPQSAKVDSARIDTPDKITRDSLAMDSSLAARSDSVVNDLPKKAEDSTTISSVTEEVLSDETVAVPKKYIYFLIGFLILTAAIVVLSSRGKKRGGAARINAIKETEIIRNDKGFESFVVALFDPHYFTLKTKARETVYAGKVPGKDFTPKLVFDFQNKDSRVSIAIDCIFITNLSSRELLSYSSNQINRYHDFEEGHGTELYLVVGLEGEPGDPKELFLIPTSELREGNLGYKDLQPFKKHGMFFYNSARRRLL